MRGGHKKWQRENIMWRKVTDAKSSGFERGWLSADGGGDHRAELWMSVPYITSWPGASPQTSANVVWGGIFHDWSHRFSSHSPLSSFFSTSSPHVTFFHSSLLYLFCTTMTSWIIKQLSSLHNLSGIFVWALFKDCGGFCFQICHIFHRITFLSLNTLSFCVTFVHVPLLTLLNNFIYQSMPL